MNTFNNLKIGTRLGMAFALLIVVALAIALFARVSLGQVNAELDLLVEDRMAKVAEVTEVIDNVNEIAISARNIVLSVEAGFKAAEAKEITELRQKNGKIVDDLTAAVTSEKGKALLKAAADARAPYNAALEKVLALGMVDKNDEAALILMKEVRPVQQTYMAALDALVGFQQELMKAQGKDVDDTVTRAS